MNGNGENNAPLAGEMKSWPKAEKLKIGTNSSLKKKTAQKTSKGKGVRTAAVTLLYRVSRIESLKIEDRLKKDFTDFLITNEFKNSLQLEYFYSFSSSSRRKRHFSRQRKHGVYKKKERRG